jgi:3-methylcrotonyl-CoA carboxylase alpha subunit
MAWTVRLGERSVVVSPDAEGHVSIGDRRYVVERLDRGVYRVALGERHWIVAVAGPRDNRWVAVDGRTAALEVTDDADRPGGRRRHVSPDLTAPMPATVTRILVAPGDSVAAGDALLMLEAMKMELAIRAPRDGTVGAVHCKVGDLVQPAVPLLDFA